MTNKDNKGYVKFFLVSILIIGLIIIRLIIDTENFLTDLWVGFLTMVVVYFLVIKEYK